MLKVKSFALILIISVVFPATVFADMHPTGIVDTPEKVEEL